VNFQSCVIVVFLYLLPFYYSQAWCHFIPSLLPLIQFIVAGRHTPIQR
jgi:hypothetical protein